MRRTTTAAAAIAATVIGLSWGSAPGVDASSSTTPVVELGRRLFFDPAVSVSGETSCASCHRPEHGFSSPETFDLDDFTTARRHSQTLVDLAGVRSFHWDGEFPTIEALVESRLVGGGPVYYGRPTTPVGGPPEVLVRRDDGAVTPFDPSAAFTPVEQRLAADGRYTDAFRAAFDSRKITAPRIAQAIAAYVRTLTSADSPFDRWRRNSGEPMMSEAAKRGFELFRGRAACTQCHSLGGFKARFTDDSFHVTGVTARAILARTVGLAPGPGTDVAPDLGRQVRTNQPRDEAAFKTPTLRDVSTHPPYMHDGSFATLEEVVRYYVKGGTPHRNLDPKVRPFAATDRDVADLVAFLESLTGDTRPGCSAPCASRVRSTRVRVVDAEGRPLAGLPLRLLPDGDAMPGAPADEELDATSATTDDAGVVEFAPGPRTHTRVLLPDGLRATTSAWVPDTCASVEMKVPVAGRARVHVRVPAATVLPRELRGSTGGAAGAVPLVVSSSALEGQMTDALRRAIARTPGASIDVVVIPERRVVTFRRSDEDAVVDGVRTVRYAAWIGVGAPTEVDLEIAVGERRVSRPVGFQPGSVTRVDLTGAVPER